MYLLLTIKGDFPAIVMFVFRWFFFIFPNLVVPNLIHVRSSTAEFSRALAVHQPMPPQVWCLKITAWLFHTGVFFVLSTGVFVFFVFSNQKHHQKTKTHRLAIEWRFGTGGKLAKKNYPYGFLPLGTGTSPFFQSLGPWKFQVTKF